MKRFLTFIFLVSVPVAMLFTAEEIPTFEQLPEIGKAIANLFGLTPEEYLKLSAVFLSAFPLTNIIKSLLSKYKNTPKWDCILPLVPGLMGGLYGYFFVGTSFAKSIAMGLIASLVYYFTKKSEKVLNIGNSNPTLQK